MINTKWHPELFQGRKSKAPYFEGWYFKQIDTKGRMLAVIPGIQKETDKKSAFIQLIYGSPPKSEYIPYHYQSFSSREDNLHIQIDESFFSEKDFVLDLQNGGTLNVTGELLFSNTVPVESRLFSPGIMGWYQLAPRMECLHGLVSADHQVNGSLMLNGEEWLFNDSPGYIEKDWGRSFPQTWIWTQSNSFPNSPGTSVMLSVARIPWMGRFFTGFLGFIYHEKKMYRFGTYTGHKITGLKISDTGAEINIHGRKTSVDFSLEKGRTAILKAPAEGRMNRDIEESSTGRLSFRLMSADSPVIAESEGYPAGVEIVGNTDILLEGLKLI